MGWEELLFPRAAGECCFPGDVPGYELDSCSGSCRVLGDVLDRMLGGGGEEVAEADLILCSFV